MGSYFAGLVCRLFITAVIAEQRKEKVRGKESSEQNKVVLLHFTVSMYNNIVIHYFKYSIIATFNYTLICFIYPHTLSI